MRQSAAGSKTLPVTPRALETIIRLSSAHAKSRLSRIVEEIDCRVALEIMTFALVIRFYIYLYMSLMFFFGKTVAPFLTHICSFSLFFDTHIL